MDDKMFELMEKMYGEILNIKSNQEQMQEDIKELKKGQVKLKLKYESLDDKISEAFEAITTLSETNEQQHKEIMEKLGGEINIIENVVGSYIKRIK